MKRFLVAFFLVSAAAQAQTIGSPIATSAAFQFFDNTGAPFANGKICTYLAGTSTPLPAYTDYTLTTQQTNPMVLDSAGRVQGGGFFIGLQQYKVVALQGGDSTCSTGTVLWSQDHIAIGSTVINGFSGSINVQGTLNQITVTNATNTITISVPTVFVTGEFSSTNPGSLLAFNSANLEIDGLGDISASGTGNWITPGYVTTGTWVGLAPLATTPVAPGGGYGGLAYQGGNTYWYYNATTDTWGTFDFSGGGGGSGCTVGGISGSVQVNNGSGGCTGDANFLYSGGIVTLAGAGHYFESAGGFLSNVTGGSWQGFNSQTDGALLRGYGLSQNVGNTAGGYFDFAPVTYNPYLGGTCTDLNGNPVTQPLPLNGLSGFGANDTVMWVSTSPQMPPGGSCGAPLPINTDYGLNINSYMFARGGLATDIGRYNAINTVYLSGGNPAGGVVAGTVIAGTLYPAGTVTTGGTLVTATYLGGYIQVGISNGAPQAGTIATVTNPLVNGDGIEAGTVYYDSGADCLEVANNALSFACVGTGAGGANTALSNLSAVSINQPLTFQSSKDIGSLAAPPRNIYLYGSGSFGSGVFELTGSPTSGRTITLPDRSTTMAGTSGALTNGHCAQFDASGNVVDAGGACTTGGGGGTVSSSTAGNVGYYTGSGASTTIGGATTFTYTSSILTVTATSSATYGIHNATGYILSDTGFNTPGTSYQAVNAISGGVNALSSAFVNYTQVGNFSTTLASGPPLTSGDTFRAGALAYYTGGSPCLAYYSGSTWACLPGFTAGVSSLNSLTGALSIVGTAHEVIVTPSGTNVTLTTPQAIDTTSAVTFASVVANGAFNSTVTGTNTAFEANGGTFIVNGAGALSAAGVIASTGASGGVNVTSQTAANSIQTVGGFNADSSGGSAAAFEVNGTTVITNLRAGTFNGLTVSSITGSTQCLQVNSSGVVSGTGTSCGGAGGVTSLNALTGALSIGAGTGITVSPSGSTVTVSIGQSVATGASVTFNAVTVNSSSSTAVNVVGGVYSATHNVTGSATNALQASVGGTYSNLGYNTGSTGVYDINNTTIINNAGQFVGAAVLATGNVEAGTSGTGVFVVNGAFGITHTVTTGTCTMYFAGGILYSTSGC